MRKIMKFPSILRLLSRKGVVEPINDFQALSDDQKNSSLATEQPRRNSIIFNFSTNDYKNIFGKCVASQEEYCRRHDIEYHSFTLPPNTNIGREIAWLKVPLLLGALEEGFEYVAFVDSDVEISPDAPDFRSLLRSEEQRCIAMANGHSGRLNSGVVFIRNCQEARNILMRIFKSVGDYLPPCDKVGWGENGYFITALKNNHALKLIPATWNNTYDKELRSFFTHYTGSLRDVYPFTEHQRQLYTDTKKKIEHLKKGEDNLEDRELLISELKSCYDEVVGSDQKSVAFSDFKSAWLYEVEALIERPKRPLNIHLCVDVSEGSESKNPYIEQLHNSLQRAGLSVITGADKFWTQDYRNIDVIHIQWLELLFNWKKPTQDQIKAARSRLLKISKTTKIFYTAHNLHLKQDYAELTLPVLELLNGLDATAVHLTDDAKEAFVNEYQNMEWVKAARHIVIPHGDYSVYHSTQGPDPFPDIDDFLFIPGGIRSKEEWELVNAAVDEAKRLDVHIVIAGQVSPSAAHWKVVKGLGDAPEHGVTRLHRSLSEIEFVTLLNKARAILIPRHQRINSGVLFAAYSFLKPCLAPAEYSPGFYQRQVGGASYTPTQVQDWKEKIALVACQPIETVINIQSKMLRVLYKNMSWDDIGHEQANAYKAVIQ